MHALTNASYQAHICKLYVYGSICIPWVPGASSNFRPSCVTRIWFVPHFLCTTSRIWSTLTVSSTNSVKVWWTGLNSTFFPVFITVVLIIFKLNNGPLIATITEWKLGVDNACALVLGPEVLDSDIEAELLHEVVSWYAGAGVHLDPPQSMMHRMALWLPAD